MEAHGARVAAIAREVRSFNERNERFRIYHGTTSTTRRTKLSRTNIIDTSGFDNVLQVDTVRRIAIVEPNVSMEKLVDSTLGFGLVAPVVMEFPAITVGGGFAGTSGESSSFRHGFFENTVSAIEIVLADGEVIRASRDENEDLLNAAAGSFGTFGVITMLEIDLVQAKPFVRLDYYPVASMDEAIETFERKTAEQDTEYLEGIMFGLDSGIVIAGRLSEGDESKHSIARFSRAEDPWFYLHAEQTLNSTHGDRQDLVPLKDYLFRYDRGAFWSGMYSFRYFLLPFNAVTRWALDNLLHTKVMYHALHKSGLADEYIVQDIGFPYATASDFVTWLHHTSGFYPLWLCPLKVQKNMGLHPRDMAAFAKDARSPGMMLNIGLWGPGPRRYDDFIVANRDIEKVTTRLGGLKCFYAQAFYPKDEFWRIYDQEWYTSLRTKYKATSLPSVCDKVNVDLGGWRPVHQLPWGRYLYERLKEQWPVKGLYGVLQIFLSREYLLA